MKKKKTEWFEVQDDETLEQCLERMKREGYAPAGRKEEPIFEKVGDEYIPLKQRTLFKGIRIDAE